jgi:molybdopterin/thiamine biosynthesis adenylyltransferase
LTLAAVDEPDSNDLDEEVIHIAIAEPYTLRVALAAEGHPLAVGIVHSHPKDCVPRPSTVDNDMDAYYGSYFSDFAPARPYVSLILSTIGGELAISGRVLWRGQWLLVDRVAIERTPTRAWVGGAPPDKGVEKHIRTARLVGAFGAEAASRLRRATVAVIGAGGTGSAAIELLARAGIGRLVIVDPDHLEESNLERVHGSRPEQAIRQDAKAAVAREHVRSIDQTCEVIAYVGALPQREILDEVVTADIALGCTDQEHSRLALSDLALRYLVPCLDCGVMLEGTTGTVTGQILQMVRFLAADPCALCRGLTSATRIAQELMPESERAQRRLAAAEARDRGENPDPYWQEESQLNTVGYLTTAAGAMVAGYAIGWLTGRLSTQSRNVRFLAR